MRLHPFDIAIVVAALECTSVIALAEEGGPVIASQPARTAPSAFTIKVDTILKGFDGKWHWFDPRVAAVPANATGGPLQIIMTQRAFMSASDYFSGYSMLISRDDGATWSAPREIPELGWQHEPGGVIHGICDFTPAWHPSTGKVLAIGHTVRYVDGKLMSEPRPREVGYAVFDPATGQWQRWRTLDLPDSRKFFSAGAGAAQWLIQPDGSLLVPIYFKSRDTSPKACYSATVLRCAFDGTTLKYLSHGDELKLDVPRGFCEPSLIRCGGRYFLTLRNDEKGYVAAGPDGLHFSKPRPWTFDDGRELGNYNTQQHWASHDDGLFLVYTRRGANNDRVRRHRAPLFIGRVDPERLCVIRASEQVVLPERGAAMGNFGVTTMNDRESWVTASEEMAGWLRTKSGPADGSVYVARLVWSSPASTQVARVPTTLDEAIAWLDARSHEMIRGSRRTMADGTAAFPPQVGSGYEAFWLRDYAYMLEGNIRAFSTEELERSCRLFVKAQRSDGAMVDCVRFNGQPVYQPGFGSMGENPVADGSQFTVDVAWHTWKRTGNTGLVREIIEPLTRAMAAVPRNPSTGLVFIRPEGWDRCPYGFTDSVRKQGDELFCSLLYVQACRQMADLVKAAGRDDVGRWEQDARTVADSINRVFWDDSFGLYRAATIKCREHDVWGSAFAVRLGVADDVRARRIARYFKEHYAGIVKHGQIRHMPGGEYWEQACPRDRYQNGAYWATPVGWFVYALDLADPALADQTVIDLVKDFIATGDVNECVNDGYKNVANYVVSAALPLEGIRALQDRRGPRPAARTRHP